MTRTRRLLLATSVTIGIVVPVFAGTADAAPAAGTAASTTTADTTVTVQTGDSLVGIAHRHGVRLSALLRANAMTLTSVIHPGDTLVVPAGATLPSPAAPSAGTSTAPASTTTSAAAGTGSTYVVQAGDALAGIAWRHGVRLGALVQANGITVSSVILPGQRLSIPPATMPVPAARTASTQNATTAAAPAAAAPSVTASPSSSATATSGSLQTLLGYLTAQVGAPYRFFSAGPDAFDCSGLVVAGFRQIGITLPHQSRALARTGSSVDWTTEPIAAGDLVFTSATNDPDQITHVGVALDSRRWVHAVGFGKTVSIGTIPASSKIMAVQRISLP